MISFLDVLERATHGPIVSVKDYDMKRFVPKVEEMVKAAQVRLSLAVPFLLKSSERFRVFFYLSLNTDIAGKISSPFLSIV